MSEPLDPELAELKARYYRWWTVGVWKFYSDDWTVKFGPLSIAVYRWYDGRWRVGVCFNFGPEHIIFGGPLD